MAVPDGRAVATRTRPRIGRWRTTASPVRRLADQYPASMGQLLRGYRGWIAVSLIIVVAEAAGGVVVPFLIGMAIDDYLEGSYRGLTALALVGVATMLLATFRRMYDVRLYAHVYERASEIAFAQNAGLSSKTARLNLLREVVDFLEHSLPGLIASVSAFIGSLVFLAVLSFPVFVAAIVMAILIGGVYALSTRRTVRLNRGYNDEYERQVDVLQQNDGALGRRHVALMNGWLIRLSDLDATNLAVSLSLTIGLQVFAIITSANAGMDAGTLLSVVLYVFEFSAVAAFLPNSWQEYLRLRDILRRLQTANSV